jgi:hypothetical protein
MSSNGFHPAHEFDENSRVSLPVKILWAILICVVSGSVFAAGVFYKIDAIGGRIDKIETHAHSHTSKIEQHEHRLIRLEIKTQIAAASTK